MKKTNAFLWLVLIPFLFVAQLFPFLKVLGKTTERKGETLGTSSSAISLLPDSAGTGKEYYRDLCSDTWVASDGLGRKMPLMEEAGQVKNDKRRIVSIFYITWHTQDHFTNFKTPYSADVSKILNADPAARKDAKHPLWSEDSYHWGEPEMGYFLSQDEYVIRKDMSMLTDAGVDVLVMDVTNAVRYWDEWEVLFATMQKM